MNLKIGSHGDNVVKLQKTLVSFGFLKSNDVDGSFGPQTEKAVIAFQKKNKLDIDGIVGENTAAKLGVTFSDTTEVPVKNKDIPTSESYKLRQKLLDIFRKEIGVRETSPNSGKRIKQYQAATWLKGTGWAWCAAFMCFGIREWLKLKEVRDAFGLDVSDVESFRPQTAGAWDFINWAKSKSEYGIKVLDDSEDPRPGDIMVFDISHIEIVEEDDDHGHVWSIGGNTDASGGRDGDGVYRRSRRQQEARAYIRLI